MTPRARQLARYGLTVRQYNQMLRLQDGRCAICRARPKSRRLSVDHDHSAAKKPSRLHGRIRGLLCHQCNRYRVGINTSLTASVVSDYLANDFDGREL